MEIMRVGKTKFNELLQGIQSEVMAFGFETRMNLSRNNDGKITRMGYEVYSDGQWHELAREIPFVGENNDGTIYEDRWTDIKFRAVQELVKS